MQLQKLEQLIENLIVVEAKRTKEAELIQAEILQRLSQKNGGSY